MPRASADWVGPLLLIIALRAVVPSAISPETSAEPPAAVRAKLATEPPEPSPPNEPAPKPCKKQLDRLLEQASLGLEEPLAVAQALVMTVPDPVDTSAGSAFDGAIEAVVSGLSTVGYVRDRFDIPWAAVDKPEEACPGVILFRPSTGDVKQTGQAGEERKPLALLIVGESAAWGLDAARFRNTLGLLDLQSRAGAELRILGPYYSASARTLAKQLESIVPGLPYRIASGTLTGDAEAELLRRTGWVQQFRSFAVKTAQRRKLALDFLGHHSAGGATIAVLQEAGTVYGQIQVRDGKGKAARGAPLLAVDYPPNVSALRDAYAVLENGAGAGDALGLRTSRVELPIGPDRRESGRDAVPVFAAQHGVVTHDLALRDAVAVLADHRIGDAIVTGVLPQDVVFLVQRLKRGMPDMRVVLYNMDRLLTHSSYAGDLRGSLVVTSYALRERSQGTLRTTLSRDSAEGVFHAVRALLGEAEPDPVLTLGVISRGRLWPLQVKDRSPAEQARAIAVPGTFWFASICAFVLALLNVVLLLHVQWSPEHERKHAHRLPAWLDRWMNRLDRRAVGRSNAWFLAGLRPCRDPLVHPWHALTVCVSQASMVATMFILALGWGLVASGEHGVAETCAYAAVALAFMICTAGAGAILVQQAKVAFQTVRAKPPASDDSASTHAARTEPRPDEPEPVPTTTAEIEDELLGRARFWAWSISLPLGLVVAAIGVLTCAGMLLVPAEDRAIFLERTLELSSGVSPLAAVLVALAFVYCLALSHASRLRILDLGDELVAGQPKRYALYRAVEEQKELLARERALYESALLPGGIRYTAGALISVGLPMLIVWHVRPSVWYRTHDFTLENACLSYAMALGLALCLSATVATTLQVLRLFRHMLEVLSAFESSDIGPSFDAVPSPLRRTVAEQLAHGPQDPEELRAVLRALQQPVAANPSVPPNGRRPSLAWTAPFTEMLDAAAQARAKVGDSSLSEDQREQLKRALAAYVAFGLLRWVKQFRFLMWLVTLGTASLLLTSSLYVFSVRHLLATMFAVLTLLAVIAGATVFAGLERDRVLSRIGDTTPGKITLQGNLLRVLGWGVLPVLLAVASYYPDAARGLVTWLTSFAAAQ